MGGKDALHHRDFRLRVAVVGLQMNDRENLPGGFFRGHHLLQEGNGGSIRNNENGEGVPMAQGPCDGKAAHQVPGGNGFVAVRADIN